MKTGDAPSFSARDLFEDLGALKFEVREQDAGDYTGMLAELNRLIGEVRARFADPHGEEARRAGRTAENVFLGALAWALADHPDGPGMWARALEATRASELVR